ncbi:MAG: AMP-binding protein, partial [Kiloniellaceae bacterium]
MALSDPIQSRRAGRAGADDLHSRATLVEVLRERAARQGDTVALNFLADGQEIGSTLDYRALDGRARALATVLRRHAAPGDRALILLPSGPDYLIAFFACFYASVIAVPAYPPQAMRPHHVARLEGMIADSTPRFLLTDREHAPEVWGLLVGDRSLRILSVDEVGDEARNGVGAGAGVGARAEWTSDLPRADDVAFLQYTSGSTSAPKGVEITHANLMDNQRVLSRGFGVTADDVFVSWLPLYHDMGLMTGLTLSVFWGCPLYLMAPQHFLARPARWLEALHRYGGTFSGGPDFAYRLCCERVNDKLLDRLDLSRWHVAFCGAEPVRADTMADFAERFAPAGFKVEALGPSYGLAEATLGVSLPRRGRRYTTLTVDAAALAANRIVPGTGVALVGCGRPPEPDTVGIFDPRSGDPCEDGLVGEVWVAGGSVARGYWENPEATREVFVRRPGEPAERVWLRTGDLGFLVDGELFITGRCKDLIILHGENCYPQDIEKVVESAVAAVRKGRVAVFAVDRDGREGIGVAVEVGRGEQRKHRPQDLVEAIDGAVVDAVQEPASLIALLEPGALPKTTSGKLQRSACRQGIAGGDIAAYHVYRRPL